MLLLFTSAYSDEQETDADSEAKRCINTGAILRTRVIDDGNVVFIMRGKKMYLNTLRRPCSGLARHGSFYYATQTRSLCEFERISPIDNAIIGMSAGGTCALGMFQPTSLDDLAWRFAAQLAERDTHEPDLPPIEEIDTDNEEGQPIESD